jgi:hypothetical protein
VFGPSGRVYASKPVTPKCAPIAACTGPEVAEPTTPAKPNEDKINERR